MDSNEFKLILRNAGVDIWALIETAIDVARREFGDELKSRREGIIEKLFACYPPCDNCFSDQVKNKSNGDGGFLENKTPTSQFRREITPEKESSPSTDRDVDEELDRCFGDPIDDEQRKILTIKEHLEDPDQTEDSLVDLLQTLADMDITFTALQETDIGRHVNRLRKHSSNEVRRLVKQLVRKWKDLVDEWVKMNTPGEITASTLIDGSSGSGSDKTNAEPESRGKVIPKREAPPRPVSASAPPSYNKRESKDTTIDPERLASARKRLHENYQEAQNAKKQRTIQVMDIHEIPKPKNAFFPKKGGFQGRH
ncbi:Transcription factor IIS, N-terminal [Dillenia turbinata]|uniref:Transcription factor IIS, N-terminal n=1 Tax=Dillenia turbinata TaxID=194707 RepID=A0AAN8Z489_9MAGN